MLGRTLSVRREADSTNDRGQQHAQSVNTL